MTLIDVIILSIVEGITEFLPISSTGHLILTSHLLAIPQTAFLKSFEIIIQLGAILAVALLSVRQLQTTFSDWTKVMLAFIPTSIVGFVLYRFIKEYLLGNELVVVVSLFIGGIIIIALELFFAKKAFHTHSIHSISRKQSILIGIFQSLSVVPGVSRAGGTIIGAMSLGISRDTAVAFSFLLAIPTMLAASGLDILETRLAFSSEELFFLTVGFIASFIVAYITVLFFLKYIKTHSFIAFGIYRIIVAIIYYFVMLR